MYRQDTKRLLPWKAITTGLALCVVINCSLSGIAREISGSTSRLKTAKSPVLFTFHSGFWLNLHHFLYLTALTESRGKQRTGVGTAQPDGISVQLSDADSRIWESAVNYYKTNLIKRDLLFDEQMVRVNGALADAADHSDFRSSDVDAQLRSTLLSVSKIYRNHWWPAHDSRNQRWVASMKPLVDQMGEKLAQRLSAVYQTSWPQGGIRVEVACYANWAGAYTVSDPNLITIASDDKLTGLTGLEILFHESSHILVTKVDDSISSICREKHLKVPAQLNHVIIFYTAGEAVIAELKGKPENPYVPYAVKYGLYDRMKEWTEYKKAIEQWWQPYLDGKTTMEAALSNLVTACAQPQQ